MTLAALAQLAGKDDAVDSADAKSAVEPSGSHSPDESTLEAAMDEFRSAPSSRAALRSLRALIAHLK